MVLKDKMWAKGIGWAVSAFNCRFNDSNIAGTKAENNISVLRTFAIEIMQLNNGRGAKWGIRKENRHINSIASRWEWKKYLPPTQS